MIVTTKYGKIKGIEQGECIVFKGIPYARPPIGELRFCKPAAPDSWEGVYHADHYGCRSMQMDHARSPFYKKEFYSNPDFQTMMSEDCLYLNIWVPKHREGEKLAVAVYVHGGAFASGAGSNLPFVCDRLASSGVIIVTINYRLGVLGFLCHPLLGIEGENEAGGNYGLWDQIAAITWVRENIGAFGGDAENLTVFGQSAGAMSLQMLAVAPQTKGLFRRMILQSGGGYRNPLGGYRSMEEAYGYAEDLFAELGFRDREWERSDALRQKVLAALRQTSAEKLVQAAGQVSLRAFDQKRGISYVPVVDGELLEKDGNSLIEEGKYHPISYMLGANGDDMMTEPHVQTEKRAETNPLHCANTAFAQIVNQNPDAKGYVYYFDRKLPGDENGAFHSAELWYVFGSLDYCWRPMEKEDYELSKKIIQYWSNFMKTGNPNQPVNSEWKICTKEDPYYMILK